MREIFGFIHLDPKHSHRAERHLCTAHEIYEEIETHPYFILLSKYLDVGKKELEEMDVSFTLKSPATLLFVTGITTAKLCKSPTLMVDLATAASM